MFLYFGFFFVGEPVAGVVLEFVLELGVDLVVVDGTAVYGVFYFDADEAATSGGVGQEVLAVGGADEGGDAGQGLVTLVVGFAEIQHVELHEVLQAGHVAWGESVELIEVDEAHHGELLFLEVLADVHLVGVVGAEAGGHEALAEGGFAPSLCLADEDGGGAVGVEVLDSHPLGGEGEHPAVEVVDPVDFGGYAGGQVGEAVVVVPEGDGCEVGSEGVVGWDVGGVEVAEELAAFAFDAGFLDLDVEGVLFAQVEDLEGGGVGVSVFGLLGEQVVLEFVVFLQVGLEGEVTGVCFVRIFDFRRIWHCSGG